MKKQENKDLFSSPWKHIQTKNYKKTPNGK